jgi:hypothetical protein
MFRLGVVVLLATTGCYIYRPVAAPGPEAGSRITAEVTREGAADLGALLGSDVAEVNGRVVEAGADTLRVSVLSVTTFRGIPASWRGELVPLPRASLNQIGERHLATGSTVLLGTALAGGLYLLYRLLGGPPIIESSGGMGGGGGR